MDIFYFLMKKIEQIANIGFFGIALWFPVTFAFLYLAEKNVLIENSIETFGLISAVSISIFITTLWVCSMIRLIRGWKNRTDSINTTYLFLLLLGTIIGSVIFHILESTATRSIIGNKNSTNLTYKGNKFVKYILIGSVLFFPIAIFIGTTANLDGKVFELVSFYATIFIVVPYFCLFTIWFLGIFRLVNEWRMRTMTINVGYALLLFFLPLVGGILFCFIDDKKESQP